MRSKPVVATAVIIAATATVLVAGSRIVDSRKRSSSATFSYGGSTIVVDFEGEITSEELFGAGPALFIRPAGADGFPQGVYHQAAPAWLRFRYSINGDEHRVLVAKEPMINGVSWNAIARTGAALGDGTTVSLPDGVYVQDATVRDRAGNTYRVRLPRCGRSTGAHLSEWNLLIGAVHEGDPDFSGARFGWIPEPYSDADLRVGYHGSLNWCQERWRPDSDYRVLRGYFYVSRFHAATPDLATTRVFWRPVLELVSSAAGQEQREPASPEVSPDRRVAYHGSVSNEHVFGSGGRITDQVDLAIGINIDGARPNWLHFQVGERDLLVAARPARVGVTWAAIARAGAVRGDGGFVSVDGEAFQQSAEVTDVRGNRYRVRLLECGSSTMDSASEWNLLIGSVHKGDGDFRAAPDGRYGWVVTPLSDDELGIGERPGGATWCMETETIAGVEHAVNRGYLTVSRFHRTAIDYADPAFGWRPVLERVRG